MLNFSLSSNHYTHVLVNLSILIRKVSFCSGWRLIETLDWSKFENKKLWNAAINEMSMSYSLPSRLRDDWRRREWKLVRVRGTEHLQQNMFCWTYHDCYTGRLSPSGFVCIPETCKSSSQPYLFYERLEIFYERQNQDTVALVDF